MKSAQVSAIAIAVLAVIVGVLLLLPKGSSSVLPQSLKPFAQGEKEIIVRVDNLSECSFAPVAYTCDSPFPTPPPISWISKVKAESFAIVVVDPDAPIGNFYHLLVYNIPPSVKEWKPGIGTYGLNSAGKEGWFPICPPRGDKAHRYYFFVLALKVKELPSGMNVNEFLRSIEGKVVAYGYTCLKYKR